MIRIHSTKKLMAKLPVDEAGRLKVDKRSTGLEANLPEALNPLSGWNANLIMLERRNCVLFVHTQTRFTVCLSCLTKPSFAQLEQYFHRTLLATLQLAGATAEQLQTARQLLQPLIIDSQTDRSTIGTLNQHKAMIEHILWDDNLSITNVVPEALGCRLSEVPAMVTKSASSVLFPVEAMLTLLDNAGSTFQRSLNETERDTPRAQGASDNVISFADFQKHK